MGASEKRAATYHPGDGPVRTVDARLVAEAWHDATCLQGRECWSRRQHAAVLEAYPDRRATAFLDGLGIKVAP